MPISPDRLRVLNERKPSASGKYVLYWMQVNRRVASNHALVYAAESANANGLPLLVYESLTDAGNDRFCTFVLEGVPETEAALKKLGAGYVFSLSDVFRKLAASAHSVVTDDHPLLAPPPDVRVTCTAVDSSCIVPMSRHEKRAYGAYTIRPKIKRELPAYLKPVEMPRLKVRWRADIPAAPARVTTAAIAKLVSQCGIDHGIQPSVEYRGGEREARRRLEVFLEDRLYRYSRESREPSKHATSNLSPYLHYGQISALDVALAVREYADEHKLMADDFLEELIVRRELAFNFAHFAGPLLQSLDVLPDWCRKTMAKHARDKRPYLYTSAQFERAATHDDLWNSCQRELLTRGTIHGYYRMYWGKKIIEWSKTYAEALETMIRLHDLYALDGRDPNTYTNILWCFGLHDRPWGERPVFGQLRYMSYDGMRRKTDVDAYIKEIALL